MQLKLFLSVTLLSMMTGICYCQEPERSNVYEIRNSVAVYLCDITGKRVDPIDRFYTPPMGAKFMLVRPLNAGNDTFIIRYLIWNKKKDSVLRRYYNDASLDTGWEKEQWQNNTGLKEETIKRNRNSELWPDTTHVTGSMPPTGKENYLKTDKYFLMQKYDLDSNCVKVYNSGLRSTVFTIGLVTMPLKLRLGKNFDFQGNLSLGTTAGVKVRLSKYNSNYINFLLGASISTISLDSFSTRGKVPSQPINDIAVFSPSLGVVFEFGKAQGGIFYGMDFLNKSTQSRFAWIYNKKSWISIGFGFSIFNVDSKSNNSASQNQ